MSCDTCGRDPARMNSAVAECSHIQCPHRRVAWSERPRPEPREQRAATRKEGDPKPLDRELERMR